MQEEYWFSSKYHVNVECAIHIHAMLEIVLVREGVLQMTVSGKEYRIQAGEGNVAAHSVVHYLSQQ